VSSRTHRRSFRSSGSVRSATSRQITTVGASPSHPRAVERRTPRSVATVPLTRILSFIGSVTGIAITYENGYVDIPKVTIDVKEATL
jgi:hypothetical protein